MASTKSADKPPVTAWSFSRYSDYKQCPKLFHYKHVQRLKEPTSDPMLRGSAIHTMAEEWIKGINKSRTIPAELKAFEELFRQLRKLYKSRTAGIVVEDDWAMTKDWDRTRWDDWVNCWVRIKLDNASNEDPDVLIIRDWKTGKFKEEMNEAYVEQLELYALAGLLMHPHVKEVHPQLVYLDAELVYPPEDEPIVYTRDDIPRLKKAWEKRVKPMFADRKFPAKPNSKCRWCWFGQAKKIAGGPGLCKF